ncbi:MAG TPA: hypothetical protein VHI32_06955 [Burkholderiales bacterium]|nr:hypothetical protein [Burkholderiales bacterium]
MNRILALVLAGASFAAVAQEQDIQRALIQRDQQSAEFAARVRGADTQRLEQLHQEQLRDAGQRDTFRPLDPDPRVARELRGYERQRMENERVLVLPPPVVRAPPAAEAEPRPITPPSRPRTLVDPIPQQTPY